MTYHLMALTIRLQDYLILSIKSALCVVPFVQITWENALNNSQILIIILKMHQRKIEMMNLMMNIVEVMPFDDRTPCTDLRYASLVDFYVNNYFYYWKSLLLDKLTKKGLTNNSWVSICNAAVSGYSTCAYGPSFIKHVKKNQSITSSSKDVELQIPVETCKSGCEEPAPVRTCLVCILTLVFWILCQQKGDD